MANFTPAFTYFMQNEDAQFKCEIVPDAPPGAHAISGINSVAYPEQYAKIAAVPQDQRQPLVKEFYQTEFWGHLDIDGLTSQDLANRVLDQAVNGGLKSGQTLLQVAINACGGSLVVDGDIGSATISAANALSQNALVDAYRTARANRYNAIVKAKPQDAKYLSQWLARARQ